MNADIRNIYCIGRNYREHAAELGNAVPDSPMVFLKPTHALVQMNGGELGLPGDSGEVHFEAELVLRIGRAYEPGIRVSELVDAMALGLDLTLRSVQDTLKKKGHPWLRAKGFLGSAPITRFIDYPGDEKARNGEFTLLRNEAVAQQGRASEMIFDFQTLADFCGRHYGLGVGDLLYTGTPAGVAPLSDGDKLKLLWNGEVLGELGVSLK